MGFKNYCGVVILFLLLTGFIANNEIIYYVSCEDIDTSTYRELKLASLDHADFTIDQACVPAKIVQIKYLGDSSNPEDEIQEFFASHANLENIEILPNCSEELFLQKCSNARLGR